MLLIWKKYLYKLGIFNCRNITRFNGKGESESWHLNEHQKNFWSFHYSSSIFCLNFSPVFLRKEFPTILWEVFHLGDRCRGRRRDSWPGRDASWPISWTSSSGRARAQLKNKQKTILGWLDFEIEMFTCFFNNIACFCMFFGVPFWQPVFLFSNKLNSIYYPEPECYAWFGLSCL